MMVEDYRFKLQLPDGSFLPQNLKLTYMLSIGDIVTVGKSQYEVLCVGLVKGILYKAQIEKVKKSILKTIKKKIGGLADGRILRLPRRQDN